MTLSERILEHLAIEGPQTSESLVKAFRLNRRTINRVLARLQESGCITRHGEGIIHDAYRYAYAAPYVPQRVRAEPITEADLDRMPPVVRDAAQELIERRRGTL